MQAGDRISEKDSLKNADLGSLVFSAGANTVASGLQCDTGMHGAHGEEPMKMAACLTSVSGKRHAQRGESGRGACGVTKEPNTFHRAACG
jgi:hypothetical protein